MNPTQTALIVGAGPGLSTSLARLFSLEGIKVALAARNTDKLTGLTTQTGARAYVCDAAKADQVQNLFDSVARDLGVPDIVVYNASSRVRGPIHTLDPEKVRAALEVSAYAGFLIARRATGEMLKSGHGTILFTGASASVKGYPESAPFAMGKFALRGLAQSIARELAPKNIHVAHVIIDGGIASSYAKPEDTGQDRWLDPDAIAREYLHLHRQHRSAWTWEIELRPWMEKF
ncbi:MAG: SDR family NAD(P)-dependent oxidoreductase [Burkholderiales bacterium]